MIWPLANCSMCGRGIGRSVSGLCNSCVQKKLCEVMSDNWVRSKLKIGEMPTPSWLLELKREQIRMMRLSRDLQKSIKDRKEHK